MALVLAHPYEEVAYDLYNLTNQHQQIGIGYDRGAGHADGREKFLAVLKKVWMHR
jgi:hypothetical protein